MNSTRLFISQCLVCLSIGTIAAFLIFSLRGQMNSTEAPIASPPEALTHEVRSAHIIERGSSVGESLRLAGLVGWQVRRLLEATDGIHDMTSVPAGLSFEIVWTGEDTPEPIKIFFALDPKRHLMVLANNHGSWNARMIKWPIRKVRKTFSGNVNVSLWDSAVAAGMDAGIIARLTSIFAWQVDFSREVRAGDRWRLVIDQEWANDELVGWGPILAAEYVRRDDLYTAVRFPQSGRDAEYFAPDGSSMRRMFLKSPIKFGRISSRFRRKRFHPILKRNVPHNGVDYAAPPGTPVMAVGDGRVELAGRRGKSGIMVRLRHNSVYKTAYLHLSRIAKGVKRGKKVKQGQVIGYVGSTGLATGPHLHFSFFEHSRFVDPLSKKFPSADPVPEKKLVEFSETVAKVLRKLPKWKVAMRR